MFYDANGLTQHTRNLRTYGSEVLLLLLSVLFFAAAFPGFLSVDGIGIFGFIALIPLFAVIRNAPWKVVWFYGWFHGLTCYLVFNYWLASFHPLAIFISPLVFSTYMLVLFPLLKLTDRLFPSYGYLVQTVIWIAYEYLRTKGFFGYAYGILGYSQYQFLPFIQISSIFGIWGVTLMTVFPSILLGNLLGDLINGSILWSREEILSFFKRHRISWVSYIVLFVAVLIFGYVSISMHEQQEPDRRWRIALVQHNADSWKGGFPTYQRNFYDLKRLSYAALADGDPEMIIWSETAFVPAVYWHDNYQTDPQMYGLVREFIDFAQELPVPLLTGNDDGRKKDESLPAVNPDGSFNRVDYNAVILYEDGELDDTYRKQHLVPMTEHFPYKDIFPRLYAFLKANDYNFWEKGTESQVFEANDGVRFSTPICFEDIFGYISAGFVTSGADVIVNMTNDSWSGSVAAQMQHLAMAVFRGVENRRSVVRGTNSGMSAVIDPTGRILVMMEPFVKGYLNTEVPIYTYRDTFYTSHVDWFAKLMILLSLLLLAAGIGSTLLERYRHKDTDA
jgi:apolipoprotein N-acyltransferase